MRYTVLLALLLVPATAFGQMTTTPATVQLGTSEMVAPDGAANAFSPGLNVAVRGRLGGEGDAVPTLHFGFERRWGSALDLYGMDVRFGVRSRGPFVFGVETGFQIRSVRFGSLPGLSGSVSGSDVWPSAAVYGAYRSGRFQIGPEVTATVWRRATATIGLHVAYVLR